MSDHWIYQQNKRNDQEAALERQLERILEDERAWDISSDTYQRDDGTRFTIDWDDDARIVEEATDSPDLYDEVVELRVKDAKQRTTAKG